METPPSSIYQSLDSSQQEIRILWLLPSTKADSSTSEPEPEIHAILTTLSLSRKPVYNALSYTWGIPHDSAARNGSDPDPDPVHRIRLNGRHFEVRSNLHDCLVHLRERGIGSQESGVPLWIDAVCINQDDVLERNSQLHMMGDIYRGAASVISWLGSAGRLVEGMRAMTEIVREWTRFEEELRAATPADGPGSLLLADGEQPVPRDRLRDWLRETEHIWDEKAAGLSGMITLFHSNYWRRVWITQELVLADWKTHVYICGTASITGYEMTNLTHCILTVFSGDRIEGVSGNVWTHITLGLLGELGVRAQFSTVQLSLDTPTLMFVLYISNTHSATNPRDVVYGLLHLIPGHDIVPDYRKAVWEVYAEWATKAMLESGNMELLSYVTVKEDHRTDVELDLPSWIPDICNYKGYRYVDWKKKKGEQENMKGVQDGRLSIDLRNNGRVLRVEGRGCDTVEKVIQLPRFAESKEPWDPRMIRFCMDYMCAQRKGGRCYPTGIPPLQALLRLVMEQRIAALSPEEYPRRVHEVAAEFIAWLIFGYNYVFRGAAPPQELLEVGASLLGLSWDEDFPETYEEAVFPGVDVRELMGWNRLGDAFSLVKKEQVVDYMIGWCDGRRLIETERACIGDGPKNTELGDRIFVVRHCESPLVFRHSDPVSGLATLLGSCSVLGLDTGETNRDLEYEELWIA